MHTHVIGAESSTNISSIHMQSFASSLLYRIWTDGKCLDNQIFDSVELCLLITQVKLYNLFLQVGMLDFLWSPQFELMRDATKGTMPYGGNEVPAQTARAYIGEYRRPCPMHYAGWSEFLLRAHFRCFLAPWLICFLIVRFLLQVRPPCMKRTDVFN